MCPKLRNPTRGLEITKKLRLSIFHRFALENLNDTIVFKLDFQPCPVFLIQSIPKTTWVFLIQLHLLENLGHPINFWSITFLHLQCPERDA